MNSKKETGRRIHGNSLPTSTPTKPKSFFKLMLSPTVQSTKLRIPEAFARAFSDELSGTAILTVPTGETWEVVLVNEDDQLWFCKGWQEFVEYFSIGFAYFLLFLYEGTLNFKVHIFSPTACEIVYPCNPRNRQNEEPLYSNQSGEEVLDHDEIVSNGASSATENSDVELVTLDCDDEPHLHGHKESMNNNTDGVTEGFAGNLSGTEHMEQELDEGSIRSSKRKETPLVDRLQSEGLEQALASVGISMPENPFFVTLIKKYNIVKGVFMIMPVGFARDCLNCKAGQIVKLEASNGNQWPVRCFKAGASFNLGTGWSVFAWENGLKVGDICVFELTDVQNRVLKVHVIAKSQLGNEDRWREQLKHKAKLAIESPTMEESTGDATASKYDTSSRVCDKGSNGDLSARDAVTSILVNISHGDNDGGHVVCSLPAHTFIDTTTLLGNVEADSTCLNPQLVQVPPVSPDSPRCAVERDGRHKREAERLDCDPGNSEHNELSAEQRPSRGAHMFAKVYTRKKWKTISCATDTAPLVGRINVGPSAKTEGAR